MTDFEMSTTHGKEGSTKQKHCNKKVPHSIKTSNNIALCHLYLGLEIQPKIFPSWRLPLKLYFSVELWSVLWIGGPEWRSLCARTLRVPILLFWQKYFMKLVRSWYPPTELAAPAGNPGSTTALIQSLVHLSDCLNIVDIKMLYDLMLNMPVGLDR